MIFVCYGVQSVAKREGMRVQRCSDEMLKAYKWKPMAIF